MAPRSGFERRSAAMFRIKIIQSHMALEICGASWHGMDTCILFEITGSNGCVSYDNDRGAGDDRILEDNLCLCSGSLRLLCRDGVFSEMKFRIPDSLGKDIWETHLNPFLNRLETSLRCLILPVPVVFLRLAFWPHSNDRSLAAGYPH